MNKYSLQMECLENIEAFSDEQMSREMAVIESVLDIFERTVLMMELSNSDVDIPDCSMFMESTFFQEDETPPATAPSPADPNAKPAEEGDATKKEETKVPTEEERKKYNSENQFRQMNKKGKIENIFISIIAFIPRFFGFLIQCVVKLFKKIFGKDKDEKVEKSTENAKNLTPEQKQEVAAGDGEDESKDGLGNFDVNNLTYTWWDQNEVVTKLQDLITVLSRFEITDIQSVERFNQFKWDAFNTETNQQTFRVVNTDGKTLVACKNQVLEKCKELDGALKAKQKAVSSQDPNVLLRIFSKRAREQHAANAEAVKTAKGICMTLKDISKKIGAMTSEMIKGFEKAYKKAEKILALQQNEQSTPPATNEGENETPTQGEVSTPVNNEEGDING